MTYPHRFELTYVSLKFAALVAVCVILVIALIAALVVIVLIRKVHLHRVHMESVIPITSRVSLTRYEVQLIPESCSLPLEYRERVALDPPPPTPDSPTTQSVVYESNGLSKESNIDHHQNQYIC